jgi:uncharacterized membrane protein YfcA
VLNGLGIPALADMPLAVLAAAAAAGFFGGFVRGYSGFGFALASVPLLTLAVPPVVAIPAVLPIELAIGLLTLPAERPRVSWRSWVWLVAGTLAGTPLGLTVLAAVPAAPMRLVLGTVVVLAVVVLWRRPALSPAMLRPGPLIGAGLMSGLLNGGTAMSGPPVIVALLGSDLAPRAARATLIAFIAFSAGFGVILSLTGGFFTSEAVGTSLLMIPTAALGGLAGLAVFARTPESRYRRASLVILLLVSIIAAASAAFSLL